MQRVTQKWILNLKHLFIKEITECKYIYIYDHITACSTQEKADVAECAQLVNLAKDIQVLIILGVQCF